MTKKKSVFDIDLTDTEHPMRFGNKTIMMSKIIKSGTAKGRYPREALRNFAKTLPPSINLNEVRKKDSSYSRYVFLHSRRK